MKWIAPSEKDSANNLLEKRLWEAADQLRANSGLNSAQYSAPVLGLIFLRFAEARFAKRRGELEKAGVTARRGGSRIDEPAAYHAEGVIYLTPNARFEDLLSLPEGGNIGQAINEAMADIEKHNPQLAGVLPRTYQIFNSTLLVSCQADTTRRPAPLPTACHSLNDTTRRSRYCRFDSRIRWPRPIIEEADAKGLKVWVSFRNNENRINIWLEGEDYVVVLAQRKDYLLPWTAFLVTFNHTRRRLQKEFESYHRMQGQKC